MHLTVYYKGYYLQLCWTGLYQDVLLFSYVFAHLRT